MNIIRTSARSRMAPAAPCAAVVVAVVSLFGCSGGGSPPAALQPTSTVLPSAAAAAQGSTRTADALGLTVMPNSWKLLPHMPTARFGSGAGVIGGSVYVVGGYNSTGLLGVNEAYNIKTKTWTIGLAPMHTPRWAFASAVAGNLLYTFGGQTSSSITSNIVEAYNPATNVWTREPTMLMPTNSNTATVYNGDIYVVGGYNGGRLAIVQKFNPRIGKWSMKTGMNVPKSGLGLGTIGTSIVAAEGLSNSGATTDNEEFFPAQNVAWTNLKSSPTAAFNVCAGAIGGSLYVAGGSSAGGAPLPILEIFTLAGNSWATGTPMNTPVILPAAAVVNKTLVCFGGSNSSFFGGTYYDLVQSYQP